MPLYTPIDQRSTLSNESGSSGGGGGGAAAGPSIRCAERMRQMILRAAPSAISIVGDMLRVAVTQGLHDEQMLKHLSKALNVGMHGWPLDPVVRRRLRVERFYQFNAVPIDTRRIETALASSHTEDELLQALYRKYQRNEIGESLDPDVALGETLLHVFACANPAMLPKVPDFVVEQASSGLSHSEYLEEVCNVLGVCTDGWPLDPDDRLRKRLESFYKHNDPKKMDRIERLMSRDFTDEQVFIALYEKYGADELGQPVQNERMIREKLTRLLQPTQNETKVEELIKYMKESRLTDAELLHAVRRMLAIGDDGLPLDAADRIRTRVRMFFRANSTNAVVGPTSILMPSSHVAAAPAQPTMGASDVPVSSGTPVRSGEPPSFQLHRPPPPPSTIRPRLKSNPPLLSPSELNELHSSTSVIDELLVEELRILRAKGAEQQSSSDGVGGTIDAGDTSSSDASSSLLTRWRRRVSKYFSKSGSTTDAPSTQSAADATSSDIPNKVLLTTITSQEEDMIVDLLCRRFQRNEIGEVVLPRKQRATTRLGFIAYVERYVVAPADILTLATRVSELNLSEDNMWEVLRRQLDALEEHTQHTSFREHLNTMMLRCAPKDLGRIDAMIVCMYEDELSHEEVLQTIMHKYGVDEAGWPVDPTKRRRTQLTLLLQRHDPDKVPLIDSLFMNMPNISDNDDRLYRTMCETYGADEQGRPVARRLSATQDHEDITAAGSHIAGDSAIRTPVTANPFFTSGDSGLDGVDTGVSPLRTGSGPGSSVNSSRGVSPGGASRYGNAHNSLTNSLQLGATPTAPSAPHAHASSTDKTGARTTRRFQDPSGARSGGGLQAAHSFAKMPSSLSLKPHRQPTSGVAATPPRGGVGASGASFYGPLRDLRARDQWDGDAAAADVAAVIGEDFLKELRVKYGGDDPQYEANSVEAHTVSDAAWRRDGEEVLPDSRPVYTFEYKSMKPSPHEAHVANPFHSMRQSARDTIAQIQTDAHACEVRRKKWGTSPTAGTVPSRPHEHMTSAYSYLTQTPIAPMTAEDYLPDESGRRIRHANVVRGVKGASIPSIPWD